MNADCEDGGVSRRTLLGAGAGVAVLGLAGGLGVTSRQGRRLLHELGLIDDVDVEVPAADVVVEEGRLPGGRAYAMARTGSRAGPVPVVVCLHPRNATERFPFDVVGLHRFAQAASANLVMAAVDGGKASYWHRRSDGSDAMAAVVDELVPLARRRGDDGPVSVLGWSMGGYGALLAAALHPDTFSGVVAVAPAVWRRYADAAPGAFDDEADFRRHDIWTRLPALAPLRVRIDCGADDPFVSSARLLLRRLPHAAGGIAPGFHDNAFWRSKAADEVAFLTQA